MNIKKEVFNNGRNKKLVSDFYKNSSDTIVIISHGFLENRNKFKLLSDIATDLYKNGLSVLTFDFCGCGESEDEKLTLSNKINDLSSAIKFAKNKGFKKIILLGYSLGGLITLKNYSKDINSLILLAPVTDKIKYSLNKRFSKEHLEELEKSNQITINLKNDKRKSIVLSKELIEERNKIKQEELLRNVNCPVLIIHGKNDKTVPFKDSQKAINILNNNSKLKSIDDTDHRFSSKESEVHKEILTWLSNFSK